MPITTKPEILSPRRPAGDQTGDRIRTGGLLKDENLDLLSHLLDDFIRIPGTPIRFGLDGIAGFIPGIGDVIGGLASSIIILAAWIRGVPYITVLRMVVNVGIETAVGSIPILGDAFDIYWRANRRNYALLAGSLESPRRHTIGSWLFLAGLCLVLAGLMLAPAFLLIWLVRTIFGMDFHWGGTHPMR